jgi:hypothetical protein
MPSTSPPEATATIARLDDARRRTIAPTVLFIGGYGRSGSTLLDRVLGSTEGCFSAGEIRHVWREGYLENRLCGCGEPFLDCPFWQRVTARAFPGGLDVERIVTVKEHVDRYQRIPLIVTGGGGRRRRAELRWYLDRLGAFYRAIGDESGATVIVDSSKDVSHGYVLDRLVPSIDLRVLHLVRDSRAVAHSWRRRKFNPGSGREMDRFGITRTSVEWVAINGLTALQRPLGDGRYARLRYEDLVGEPRRSVERVLRFVGRPVGGGAGTVPVGTDGLVELRPSHTVAGNPMRFHSGPTRIEADDEWRERMPAWSRRVVTALTFPVLAATRHSTV